MAAQDAAQAAAPVQPTRSAATRANTLTTAPASRLRATPTTRSAARSAAVPPEPDTAPLRVQIASMSKASLPARGSIKVRGTVTNRSDETWTTIKLYAFVGAGLEPMTDPADLAAAMDVPYDAQVGERLVDVGEPGLIESLAPGSSARYVVTVPVDALAISPGDQDAEGVYWFGVHALGQGGALPRDTIADGRARTFLPYVARRTEPVPASLIVPLTRSATFADDGAVADVAQWEQRLSPGGRLRDLLVLGQAGASTGVPITWLVDPALVDVIGRLAAGNPARSLTATPADGRSEDQAGDQAGGEGASPAPTDTGSPGATDPTSNPTAPAGNPAGAPMQDPGDGSSDDTDSAATPDAPFAVAARDWLEAADQVFTRGEVLTLPYGNTDVAATQRLEPGLLDLALAQRSSTLASLGIDDRQVVAAPGGYVDTALVAAAPDGVALLVSDRYLAAPAPAGARLDGHQLVTTSSGAAQGSPGPGRSLSAVGLRQRVLAEAAVRTLPDLPSGIDPDPDPAADPEVGAGDASEPRSVRGEPLVVMLPTGWDLSDAEELVDGLDQDWVSFGPLASATGQATTTEISDDDLATFPEVADPVTDTDPAATPTPTPGATPDPVDAAQADPTEADPTETDPTEADPTPAVAPRGLQAQTLSAVQSLITTGDTLQRVLVDNTDLGARVTEEALSGLSYATRRQQRATRASLALSRSWLETRLGAVQVTASSGVTLSGDSGTFVVTLSNDLDEAVTVSIASQSDDGLTIEAVDPIELGARGRTSVLLNVTATTSRVHTVTLMVTDADGVPLGATDELPIRSVLVSGVIWVILGVGVGTLFLAIGLRLRRRLLAARRDGARPA